MAGHQHGDAKRYAGISVCVALEAERNKDDSKNQDAGSEDQSIAGIIRAGQCSGRRAQRRPGETLRGDGRAAPRVDCATKSDTTAATAVRAECCKVSGLSLPMSGLKMDFIV